MMSIRSPKNLLLWLLLISLFGICSSVQAARGEPGSAAFGVGATLYPDGLYAKEALQMALDLQLDWVAIPVDWQQRQPEVGQPPCLDDLQPVLRALAEHQIGVVVQLSHAPAWAQTQSGPEPQQTAAFLAALLQAYPHEIQAVELFPGANTPQAWGAAPDPAAYMALYRLVQAQLRTEYPALVLIAAGLQVVPPGASGAMDDLLFLQGMYDQGAAQLVQVVSLRFPELRGDPFQLPSAAEPRVLRRYEDVRRVMVRNNHPSARIWITHFRPPSITIDTQTLPETSYNVQSSWLLQAHVQLRAQVYVGVVFLQSLNVEREGMDAQSASLLDPQGNRHPVYQDLKTLIERNQAGEAQVVPGGPKDGSFVKNRP